MASGLRIQLQSLIKRRAVNKLEQFHHGRLHASFRDSAMPLKQMEPNRKEDDPSSKTATQPAQTLHRKGPNFAKKKDKFGRKRSQSFSGVNSKFCPPYKYRTRPMLPTKFLLGGNICDPLNLNSLQDEEVNRTVNAITPKSSPIPTPPQRRGHIEVIIPPNIHDPLNLIDCADDAEYEQQLTSPLKKGNKRRKKKKRTSSATTEPSDADISASEAQTPDLSNDSAKIPDLEPRWSGAEDPAPKEKLSRVTRELKLELTPVKDKKRKSDSHKEGVKKIRRLDSMDKIVSPVVPQPGAWLKRALQFNRNHQGPSNRGQNCRPSGLKAKENGGKVPQFRDKNKAYQYGNYNRYYGYRNPNHEVDSRLRCFAAHRHIFEGKDILDIGCNIGHITLSIARDFGAKSVVGIDIDKKLIGIARKNVRHYVNCNDSPRDESECSSRPDKSDKCFPISMPILYGPVDVPGMQNDEVRGQGFPHNVTFVQGNYVLEDDSLLCTEQPQFDVILCLSITKWLHLNWGDAGLKQAFRRMYAQLKPGGKLILEPQSWASYKHKKTLTETIYKNYNSIEFFPEKFTQYLLSSEVGFAKSEIMGQPHHTAKGFQRPIQVFTRSNLSPSHSQRSYSITPSHTVTSGSCTASGVAGKQVYTCLPLPDDVASVQVDLAPGGAAGEAVVCGAGDLESVRSAGVGTRANDTQDQPVITDGAGTKSSIVLGRQETVNKLTETVADKQTGGRAADNRDTATDKQEQDGQIMDKQEQSNKIADKEELGCKVTDNQATSTDKQAAGSRAADNRIIKLKVQIHPVTVQLINLNSLPVNQASSTYSSVNQAKLPNNPHNLVAGPTNVTSTSLTAATTPDNQESSGKSPHNQVTTPTITTTNNKCTNSNEFRDQNTPNTLNNAGGHLATTPSATPTVGAKKRKHTAPGNPNSDSTPAKRQFVCPGKRKTNSAAVKRKYTGDVAYTKRKNDQSATGSTLTARNSTLVRANDGGTRLDDALTNDEEIATDCPSTTGKSTSGQSTQYRVIQKTKCIMDNT
ncbi:uncharacterized protein CBL_09784 [Carabus blaptoides fortunei]